VAVKKRKAKRIFWDDDLAAYADPETTDVCTEEELVPASDYDALAARLAEAERLLELALVLDPYAPADQDGWRKIREFLATPDSADDGLLADRVHKDGKLYRERR
jgi:hypothetical protein